MHSALREQEATTPHYRSLNITPGPGSDARRKDAPRWSANPLSSPTAATLVAPPVSCPLPWDSSVRDSITPGPGRRRDFCHGLLWYSIGRHARASVVAQVVVNTALVSHGGFCVCTGIGTRREFFGFRQFAVSWYTGTPRCCIWWSRFDDDHRRQRRAARGERDRLHAPRCRNRCGDRGSLPCAWEAGDAFQRGK